RARSRRHRDAGQGWCTGGRYQRDLPAWRLLAVRTGRAPSPPVTRHFSAAPHGLAVLIALLLASFAFLYRFNALGGALGGFDNDEFQMLTRVDLILAGEQPLRDFADGEMRGVWPSLSYE